MKREFKVGDRVAVYDGHIRYLGSIQAVLSDEIVNVNGDHFNVRQCRLLKPKRKLREFWILLSADGHIRFGRDHKFVSNYDDEMIQVREVRVKK